MERASMRSPEADAIIAQIDGKLKILRQGWLDATDDKKPNWMKQINAALDERIRHMKVKVGEKTYLVIKRKLTIPNQA